MKTFSRYVSLSVLFIGLGFLITQLTHAEQSVVANVIDWPTPPQSVSTAGTPGDRPTIADAPNANEDLMMIVYNKWNNNSQLTKDPYYSISEDNGATWSTPSLINHPNSIADATKVVDVVFDGNNPAVAHVVWVEVIREVVNDIPVTNSYIRYAQKQAANPNWAVHRTLYATDEQFPPKVEPIQQARIIVDAGGALNVVWDSDGEILHARSVDGGNSWPDPESINSGGGRVAEVDASDDGQLHLVWEQRAGGSADTIIYYSRRSAGFSGTWSNPVEISDSSSTIQSFQQPDVVVSDQHVSVLYTFVNTEPSANEQRVYLSQCLTSTNCTTAANWNEIYEISPRVVNVNDNAPFTVLGRLAYDGNDPDGAVHAFYHGYFPSQTVVTNERIWSASNCSTDDWQRINLNTTDEVESDNVNVFRNSNPSVFFKDGELHLVYEQVDVNGNYRIFYTSADFSCSEVEPPEQDPTIYLPLIGNG